MTRATLQTNFTSGELDPEQAARIDTERYYNGAERLRNVVVKASGGVIRAPGTQYISTLKGLVLDIVRGDVTATAPRGGTAANALDGDPSTLLTTTTAIGTINPYIIAHYNMGSAVSVASAEVIGASIDVPTTSAADTGYQQFSKVEEENPGTYTWRNLENVINDQSKFAWTPLYDANDSAGPGKESVIRVSGANLASLIPPNATITGVGIKVRKARYDFNNSDGIDVNDTVAQLIVDGVRVGTNQPDANDWTAENMQVTYGGSSDLWGWPLTRDQIVKSNFGFAFAMRDMNPVGSNSSVEGGLIRNISVIVYYTVAKVASPTEFRIQYSTDNSAWNNYGGAFQVRDNEEVSHRYVSTITARYWRVARVGSTDLGAAVATIRDFNLTLAQDALSIDIAGISNVVLVPFIFSRNQRYLIVFTDRNAAVFQNREFVVNVSSPFTSEQLLTLDFDQRLDTVILTHPDVPPQKMVRQGAADKWIISAAIFTTVPFYAFSPAEANPAATLTPSATTGSIVLTAGSSVFAAGHVGQYVSGNGGRARIYEYTSGTAVKALVEIDFFDAAAIASGSWTLETGYEAVWSASRGYPKTCVFYQNRLIFGGTRSLPDTVLASRIGLYFDFNLGTAADDDAIMATMENRDIAGINAIVAGRHLQVFTESGEFYVPQSENVALTPSNFIIRNTTSVGTKAGVKPQKVGESTLFVQIEGESVRELTYRTGIDDTADSVGIYSADDITEYSAHLIDDPVSIAYRRGVNKDKPNLVVVVNQDGTIAFLTKQPGRNLNAWTLRTTQGSFRRVGTLGDEIYCVVERTINDIVYRYLEVFDDSILLDCAVVDTTTLGAPVSGLSNLAHLEGETLKVIIDGALQNDLTVASGAVTFAVDSEEAYQIGIGFDPLIRPMPAAREPGEDRIISGKKRMLEATLMISDTQWAEINGRPLSFQQFGPAPSPLDTTITPFTGRKTIEGFLGWDDTAQIDITQGDIPLAMTIIGIERRIIF